MSASVAIVDLKKANDSDEIFDHGPRAFLGLAFRALNSSDVRYPRFLPERGIGSTFSLVVQAAPIWSLILPHSVE
jgi:hypothetical protein